MQKINIDFSNSNIDFNNQQIFLEFEKVLNNITNEKKDENKVLSFEKNIKKIDNEYIENLKLISKKIKNTSDIFVIISKEEYVLALKAMLKIFNIQNDTQIIFLGDDYDIIKIQNTLEVLKNKNFSVLAISGKDLSLETNIHFKLIENLAKEKYGNAGASQRFYIITDKLSRNI